MLSYSKPFVQYFQCFDEFQFLPVYGDLLYNPFDVIKILHWKFLTCLFMILAQTVMADMPGMQYVILIVVLLIL